MGVLDSLFRRRDNSASAAKTRLLKVLVDDRYKLTPDMMAQLKTDLAEVFARYLPSIDPDSIEVTLQRGESNDHLKADIPLRRTPNP
ncbi:MAG: cell division topological specificity factor MinE [Chloroflexota bacterium]|jgi:cell division topological specificity factor MinE|nr:MAG: cell division topological specificity factor MinE [Chloroflexota bacterium]